MEIGIDDGLWVTDGKDAEHIRIEVGMPNGPGAEADLDCFFAADLRDVLSDFVSGRLKLNAPTPASGYVHTLSPSAKEALIHDCGDPRTPKASASSTVAALVDAVWDLGWRNRDPQLPRVDEWHTASCWGEIQAGGECEEKCSAVRAALRDTGREP